MTLATLRSTDFWRDAAERLVRQLSQVAVPILVAASAGGTGWSIDWPTFALTVAATALVTAGKVVLTSLNGWEPGASAPLWQQLLDRGGSAALTTVVAFFPADIARLSDVDWSVVAWMGLLSGLIACAQYFADPPTFTRGRHIA
jgi:hypothetical protein